MNPFFSDAVVIAAIGGVVSLITTRISTQSKKQTNEILNRLDGVTEQIQDVRMDVQKVESIGNDNREGIRTVARFRLYDTMSKAIERGWTTVEEAREIGKLYQAYVNLGGNGEIHDLHEIFLRLPIKTKTEIKQLREDVKIWNNYKQQSSMES